MFNNTKKIILLILISLLNNIDSLSQTFTKITDGDFVNEEFNSGGSSWADIDNDNDLDLFVANGNLDLQPNSLFINNGDGTFTRFTNGEIVNELGKSIGGVWGDLENDGDLDLFVTNRESSTNFLYANNGNSAFTKITNSSAVNDPSNSNNSYWVDIENDGDLDIFVINFNSVNFLYLNDGSGNFTKFTNTSIVMDSDLSIVGAWADYDNDGDLDLFKGLGGDSSDILYDNKGNYLFERNNDPTILSENKPTIGASWADYDNDGYFDLYVANFLDHNNSLFNNNGNGSFTKIITGEIVNDGGFSAGTSWGDLDNDGDLDLFVGNYGQNNFLYLNDGPPNYTFTKITSGEIVTDGGNTFGVSMCDYDNDGDLDVFAANQDNQKNLFYKNNGNDNNWINIKLMGVAANKPAIGTVVRLKAIINGSAQWQLRQVESQSGYNSQNSLNIEFGLGDAEVIDSIIIEWPGSIKQVLINVTTNQFIVIEEDDETDVGDFNPNRILSKYNLEQNYPNPFNPITLISWQSAVSSWQTLKVYDVLGNEIANLINEEKPAGNYEMVFDGNGLTSGIYFYTLKANNFTFTRKMILLK